MEELKLMYGANKCFFLSINSQATVDSTMHIADPWAQFLLSSINYKVSFCLNNFVKLGNVGQIIAHIC